MPTATDSPTGEIDLAFVADATMRMRREVGRVVIGQVDVVEQMMTALISGGHCLLIGVPGLAKTVMAKALADVLDMQFKRVQFTPDLMPSDITGTTILHEDRQTGKKSFKFVPGPVFTNVLLADEINRTPPKTQASLLEAMQEHRVTFGNEQRKLPQPFFVIATQNPLEQEGTYPLPEAQLDRFMFSVIVNYPTHAEENAIVTATTENRRVQLDKVLTAEQIAAMQRLVRAAPTPPEVVRYAVALARATRPADPTSPDFMRKYADCGAGPRAGQYLTLAAKSRAILNGRETATIEDVQAAAIPVLRHRVFTNFTALAENISTDTLIKQLVKTVPAQAQGGVLGYKPADVPDAGPVVLDENLSAVEVIRQMKDLTERIRNEVQQRIVGQIDVVDLVLTALLGGGHCLLVGVPGLAKTTLVQTLADVLDLDFKRVQFTPDLMPSDITGTDIMETDEATGERTFRFIHGPVFTNLLLADEINRTPPKTQASLLEAMQEKSVTSGGTTYELDLPFFVLATQNPLEQEGTYPLPEAQLDRFMFNIHLDYPLADEEPVIIDRTTKKSGREPKKVIGAAEILRLQKIVRQVPISDHVLTYVTTLVRATRPETKDSPDIIKKYVHCGAGPRACQNLVLGAKARAVMNGRPNVSIADVKAVAVPVLRHRLFTNFAADAEGVSAEKIVAELVARLKEPTAKEEKKLSNQAVQPATETPRQPRHAAPTATKAPEPRREAPAPASESAADDADGKPERFNVMCGNCGQLVKVPRKAIGKKVKCPSCAHIFAVMEPAGD
jgi:MoxR-like ATPase